MPEPPEDVEPGDRDDGHAPTETDRRRSGDADPKSDWTAPSTPMPVADADDSFPLLRGSSSKSVLDKRPLFFDRDFDESELPHLPLCRRPFYPKEVRDLAERMHKNRKTVKPSWCLGPVMNFVIHMPFVYLVLVFVVVGSSLFMSSCNGHNHIADSSWPWVFWVPILFLLLFAEHYVLMHISVPFDQKTGGEWPNPMLQILDASMPGSWWSFRRSSYTFATWYFWHTVTSAVRLLSFFTTNMLIGSVLGDLYRGMCDGSAVERVWHSAIQQSIFLSMASDFISLRGVFLFLLVVQILYFLAGVALSYPRYKQWTDQGTMPPEKSKTGRRTWYQEFETEIIEHVSYQAEDPRRPMGTRFAYVPLCCSELTSSQALQKVGVCCGMTSIEAIQAFDMKAHEVDDTMKVVGEAEASPEDSKKVRRAMEETRKLLQDSRVASRSFSLNILLYGCLFSILNLHLQITYFNSRSMHLRSGKWVIEQGYAAPNLLIGVLSGFSSIVMIIQKAWNLLQFRRYVARVVYKYDAVSDEHRQAWQEREDLSSSQHLHNQIQQLKYGRMFYDFTIWFALSCLVLNFLWAAVKWVMVSFFCPDKIWNLNINLPAGCVEL